jgi:hypothetical protein
MFDESANDTLITTPIHDFWARFTKRTASIVRTIPKAIKRVNGSSNKNHAITAVVGGVRYIRLVTRVASPLRIMINRSDMAPIDNPKMAQTKDPINSGCQTISLVSKRNIKGRHKSAELAN